MSGHGTPVKKNWSARVIQAGALALTFGGLLLVTKVTPELQSELGTAAAVGFLLLAGTLTSELFEIVGLPHLSGYLLAGIVGGPHVLHLVDHDTVERLKPVNTLALALIAFAGGAELRIETLREVLKSLLTASILQCIVVFVGVTGLFLGLARFVPFTHGLTTNALFGVAILWAVLAISRSPSACLGILSQTRAKGPVATFSLAFIMLSDVIVLILLAAALMLTRPLIVPGATLSAEDFHHLYREILGSVAVGTTIGLLLAAYLRLVGGHFIVVLLTLGFGVTEGLKYIDVDPLLTFLTAGFVVQNMTSQGAKLLHKVEQTASIVFVVFFATAGAHLDLPLVKQMWPIALGLCVGRAFFTIIAAKISSRIANDVPAVRKYGWSSLVSQAGLAIGVSVTIANTFPTFGDGFRSLAIAAVAFNEVFGPVMFKLALDRAGETAESAPASRTSLIPEAASQ